MPTKKLINRFIENCYHIELISSMVVDLFWLTLLPVLFEGVEGKVSDRSVALKNFFLFLLWFHLFYSGSKSLEWYGLFLLFSLWYILAFDFFFLLWWAWRWRWGRWRLRWWWRLSFVVSPFLPRSASLSRLNNRKGLNWLRDSGSNGLLKFYRQPGKSQPVIAQILRM